MKIIISILNINKIPLILLVVLALGGCTSTEIDEFRQGETQISSDESIVILGRRQNNNYETASDFVQCVSKVVSSGRNSIEVINEEDFVDALFPFFEPRTAPMRTEHLKQLMDQNLAAEKINDFGVEYIIWLDGETLRSSETGGMTCAAGPGGAGCLGFGTWVDDSKFEAEIWDIDTLSSVGSISTEANGQSYLPALIIPIPLLARVEANACNALGDQLKGFINGS